MKTLIDPHFILVLAVCVSFGILAFDAATGRRTVRAVLYGVVAVLALIAVIVLLFGL